MSKQLKTLNTKHRIMLSRLLLGDKATDIALDLNMSDSTFSIIRNSPLFKAELDRMTQVARHTIIQTSLQVAEVINASAPEAARTMVSLLNSESEHVQLRAAEKLINYSDFGREHDIEAHKPIIISQQQMVLIDEGLGTPTNGAGSYSPALNSNVKDILIQDNTNDINNNDDTDAPLDSFNNSTPNNQTSPQRQVKTPELRQPPKTSSHLGPPKPTPNPQCESYE